MDAYQAAKDARTDGFIIALLAIAKPSSQASATGTNFAFLGVRIAVLDVGIASERKTCSFCIRFIATAVPLLMLLWIMDTGFKLATEPRRDPRYNNLALLVGVISIMFGVLYLINGLIMVAGLVLELLGLQPLPEEEADLEEDFYHQDGDHDASHYV